MHTAQHCMVAVIRNVTLRSPHHFLNPRGARNCLILRMLCEPEQPASDQGPELCHT